MVTAKCLRCLGSAVGKTLTEATDKINHAVGKSRGLPCGKNYNKVVEVGSSTPKPKKTDTEKPKSDKPKKVKEDSSPISKQE